MQEYDVTLKLLLKGSAKLTMHELTGTAIDKWSDVELPKVQNPRADLLGETASSDIIHTELQSWNDGDMPLRMAEYCLAVYRLYKRFPSQVVLYVGEAPLQMKSELVGPKCSFRYDVIDIRELDGDLLLESEEVGDNIIAILTRLRDHKEAVRKIVARIAGLETGRETALAQLMILAGLRRLAKTVEEEVRKMPIDLDIREHEVLGPMFEQARQEGELKGRQEGRHEGELTVLCRQIEKRFGAIPGWAKEKLAGRTTVELEALSIRVLDARNLEELLQ